MVYELLGFSVNYNFPFELRNGADVLIRQFFLLFGKIGDLLLVLTLILISIIFFVKAKKNLSKNSFNIFYLTLMIFEGLIFGSVLFIIFVNKPSLLILGLSNLSILEKLYLAIGAGIFEEFIFRFLFIGLVSYLILLVLKINKIKLTFLLILLSSFLFSGFHYIGNFGDIFDWSTFLLRFTAGFYLGVLFIFRGFGISVISHIVYDFIVLKGM
tara:strand:+ start:5598 stop:6236 length:639 start_codon:yes stop_codon:yes gene_type:complete